MFLLFRTLLFCSLISLLVSCSKKDDPVSPSYSQAQKDSATLTLRPFSIALKDRFPNDYGSGLTFPGPVKRITVSEGEAKLKAFIKDPAQQAEALRLYADVQVVKLMPDPEVRAGMAAISRYKAGQEVINRLLTGKTSTGLPLFKLVTRGTLPDGVFAETNISANGQYTITFNNAITADIGLGAELPHEVLHAHESPDKDGNSTFEEGTLHYINGAMHALMVQDEPSLAEAGNPYREHMNREAMLLLNGGPGAALGLLGANTNRGLLPEGKFLFKSFKEYVVTGYPTKPSWKSTSYAPDFFYQFKQTLFGEASSKSQFPNFSEAFFDDLDRIVRKNTSKSASQSINDVFGYSQRIQMMKVLGATIPSSPL
ncbi:hypothetical protein GCM10027592_57440 [Spirosoma flavus]